MQETNPNNTIPYTQLKICLECLCLQHKQSKFQQESHHGHTIIHFHELLQKISIFKCNVRFTQDHPNQVQSLFSLLQQIYKNILDFQHQIICSFRDLKYQTFQHINKVKQSFGSQFYEQVKTDLFSQFTPSNVRYILSQIQKFKKIQYSDLSYPFSKAQSMKEFILNLQAEYQRDIFQKINLFINKLHPFNIQFEKSHLLNRRQVKKIPQKDLLGQKSRSIYTFMDLNPSQTAVFSLYMRSHQYSISEDGKSLSKQKKTKSGIGFIAIEKELSPGTQISLQIQKLEKGIFIGFLPIQQINKLKCSNLIQSPFSHFITNQGLNLPLKDQTSKLKSVPFKFGQGDIITISRASNVVVFIKNIHSKNSLRFEIPLTIEQNAMSLHPCIHLQAQSVIKILN